MAKAAHRIEECFRRAKGEAGLGDYQVRNWIAWHHHQTLSLLAAWFLNKETRRGKKTDPGIDVSATATVDRRADRRSPEDKSPRFTFVAAAPAGCNAMNKHGFIIHRSRNILPRLKNQLRT